MYTAQCRECYIYKVTLYTAQCRSALSTEISVEKDSYNGFLTNVFLLYPCKQSLEGISKHFVHLSVDFILSMCHAAKDGGPVSQTKFIGGLELDLF